MDPADKQIMVSVSETNRTYAGGLSGPGLGWKIGEYTAPVSVPLFKFTSGVVSGGESVLLSPVQITRSYYLLVSGKSKFSQEFPTMNMVLNDRPALLAATQALVKEQQSFLFTSYWRTNTSDAINSCAETAGEFLIPGALFVFSAPAAFRSVVSEMTWLGRSAKIGLKAGRNALKDLMPPPMLEAVAINGMRMPVPFRVPAGSAVLNGLPPLSSAPGVSAGPTILMMSAAGVQRGTKKRGRGNKTKKGSPIKRKWISYKYTRKQFLAAAKEYDGNRTEMAERLGVTQEAVSWQIVRHADDPEISYWLNRKGKAGGPRGALRKLLVDGRRKGGGKWSPATVIAKVLKEPGMTITEAAERLGYKRPGGLRVRIHSDPELSEFESMIDGRFDNTRPKSIGKKAVKKKPAPVVEKKFETQPAAKPPETIAEEPPVDRLTLLRKRVLANTLRAMRRN